MQSPGPTGLLDRGERRFLKLLEYLFCRPFDRPFRCLLSRGTYRSPALVILLALRRASLGLCRWRVGSTLLLPGTRYLFGSLRAHSAKTHPFRYGGSCLLLVFLPGRRIRKPMEVAGSWGRFVQGVGSRKAGSPSVLTKKVTIGWMRVSREDLPGPRGVYLCPPNLLVPTDDALGPASPLRWTTSVRPA